MLQMIPYTSFTLESPYSNDNEYRMSKRTCIYLLRYVMGLASEKKIIVFNERQFVIMESAFLLKKKNLFS